MHPKRIYDVRWRQTVYFSVKLQRNYVVLQIAYTIICLLSCKILEYITYILLKFFLQCNYFFVDVKNTELCCI